MNRAQCRRRDRRGPRGRGSDPARRRIRPCAAVHRRFSPESAPASGARLRTGACRSPPARDQRRSASPCRRAARGAAVNFLRSRCGARLRACRLAAGGGRIRCDLRAGELPFAEALLDAPGVGAGIRVLDLCCGTGVVTGGGCGAARGVPIGVDFSPAMLAEAGRAQPRLQFDEGDAEALPDPEDLFDASSNFGVHHLCPGRTGRLPRRCGCSLPGAGCLHHLGGAG